MAFKDVKAAFDLYMKEHNAGRPGSKSAAEEYCDGLLYFVREGGESFVGDVLAVIEYCKVRKNIRENQENNMRSQSVTSKS